MFTRMYMLLLAAVLQLIPLCLSASQHPFGLNENHPFGRLTTEYVTPHVKWADPYHSGKIRALVLAPIWSQRETVELAERLSLDFTPWMTAKFSEVISSTAVDPAAAFFVAPPDLVYGLLKEYLKKDYDVIIVGKLDWAIIPSEQRFELLKKVSEGTGLVYINPPAGNKELDIVLSRNQLPEGASLITANLPISSLPRFKNIKQDELVKTMTYGKGRVVALDYHEPFEVKNSEAASCLTPQWDLKEFMNGFTPISDLPEIEMVPYEYYQALVAKAVIWAGQKESSVRVKSIGAAAQYTWSASGQRVSVELENSGNSAMVSAAVRSRRDYARVYSLGKKVAQATSHFELPTIPSGDYYIDVWALSSDGKRILDWGSRAFTVVSDVNFNPISLGQRSYNPGDAITGKVALSRTPKADEKIVVSLWDNFNRKLQTCQVAPASMEFRFAPISPLTTIHEVRAQLLRSGKEVCRTEIAFPVRANRQRDDFAEIVWSGAENRHLTHLMFRKLADADESDAIDVTWGGATSARNVTGANLQLVPYVGRFGCFGSPPNHIVPEIPGPAAANGCMSSPVTLEGVDKWGATQSDIFGPYGTFAWTQGDETHYSLTDPDICWSPSCLSAYRAYLKSEYPSLESLNKEWGTSFASWEEVTPITYKEAKETGVYARWLTHRLSSSLVFAKFFRRTGEALSKNDPAVRPGFDGAHAFECPNNGGDWWLLSKETDILQAYLGNSEQIEVIRSFAKPDQLAGTWYGTYGLNWIGVGGNTVENCHFFPWYSLFHGLNTTWFWMMGNPGPTSGYAPDMTNLPFFEARTQALREIKSGIGKLLLSGTRINDRIAIHYSETSRIADSLYAAKDGDWGTAHIQSMASFNKALEDTGLQYEYASYEEVAKGMLTKQGFKVLIMPHSRSVSEAEAAEIRKFVQSGGIVIADIIPGILNGHGAPQSKGMLSDLFPVDRPGEITVVGKGKTILVCDLLAGYGKAHSSPEGKKSWLPLREKQSQLAGLLKTHAGIVPQVAVAPSKGDIMPPTEISRVKCGDNEFVGILRDSNLYDNEPYDATVRFSAKHHVYDVLARNYIAFTDRVDANISYQARLYALSPYKVQSVSAKTQANAKAGTSTPVSMSIKTSAGGKPSRHVFRVEVISPDGKNLPYYARNVVANEGAAGTSIPWALNDKPGKYTVVVRDIMSGVTSKRTVKLIGGGG